MTNEPCWEIELTPEQKARLADLLEQASGSYHVGETLDEHFRLLLLSLGQMNSPDFWKSMWERTHPACREKEFKDHGGTPTPANGLSRAKRWLEQIQQQLNVYNNLVGEIRSFLEEAESGEVLNSCPVSCPHLLHNFADDAGPWYNYCGKYKHGLLQRLEHSESVMLVRCDLPVRCKECIRDGEECIKNDPC